MTAQDIQNIQDWLDGKVPFASAADALKEFRIMHAAVERKALEDLGAATKKTAIQEKRIERLDKSSKKQLAEGNYAELGFDSMEIAQALRHCLREHVGSLQLRKGHTVAIIYEIYSSWLGSKGERITVEHPVATQYGPTFWRVYDKLDKYPAPTLSDFSLVAGKNPGLAAMIKNAAAKYATYPIRDLMRFHMNNDAYRNADKDHNGGKWNKELDDRDIWLWRNNVH